MSYSSPLLFSLYDVYIIAPLSFVVNKRWCFCCVSFVSECIESSSEIAELSIEFFQVVLFGGVNHTNIVTKIFIALASGNHEVGGFDGLKGGVKHLFVSNSHSRDFIEHSTELNERHRIYTDSVSVIPSFFIDARGCLIEKVDEAFH